MIRRPDHDPETRVGHCCGCRSWAVVLIKVPGIYRYRCAECFERECGYRHHLAPPKAGAA